MHIASTDYNIHDQSNGVNRWHGIFYNGSVVATVGARVSCKPMRVVCDSFAACFQAVFGVPRVSHIGTSLNGPLDAQVEAKTDPTPFWDS